MKLFLFIIFTLAIIFVSLMPPTFATPAILQGNDKLLHVIMYALFVLFALPLVHSKKNLLYFCLAIAAFGAIIEVAQNFSPGRTMSLDDMIANVIGITIGAVIGLFTMKEQSDSEI